MSHPSRPDASGPVERRTRAVGRRRLLLGALGAGVLHACSSSAASTDGSSSGPSSTGGPSTSPATPSPATLDTTEPHRTATPTAANAERVADDRGTPDAIDDAATVSSPAERVEPPPPPAAYDRDALYVALYGFPGSTVLGALGEQNVEATVRRAQNVARPYEQFSRRVVPTFEMIGSVAAAQPGADGNYSNEFPPSRFAAHLEAAADAGIHTVIDLQPGRSTFPDQARRYEELWIIPHVSIALDPEWRVGPTQRPGRGVIGTVDAAEVNETIDYIDDLIRLHHLPPKMCIVHQFTPSMITNKQQIRGTDVVQVVIQMDGFGTLELKRGSWGRTVADLPAGAFTGWKNFYDEDQPTPTPAETMANQPTPHFVSYQ